MSVVPKSLIKTQYASASGTTLYSVPNGTTAAIVDKFTAWNSDSTSQSISVWICNGASPDNSNLVAVRTLSSGAGADFTELQNQVLSAGESIYVLAGAASKVAVRASGREVT